MCKWKAIYDSLLPYIRLQVMPTFRPWHRLNAALSCPKDDQPGVIGATGPPTFEPWLCPCQGSHLHDGTKFLMNSQQLKVL